MAGVSVRGRFRTLFPRGDDAEPERGRNGLALVLSFVVAVVLWFTFSMQEAYTTTVIVPLQVASLPDGQALRRPPPPQARVSVQGRGEDLLSLVWSPPRVRLFADGPTVDVAAAVSEAGLPAGVDVLGAQPRTIRLDLDESVEREVPVRLDGEVRAAASFDLLAPPTLSPASVTLTGAASLLRELDAWPTTPYTRTDLRTDLVVRLPLSDTLSGLVERSAAAATLTARVGEFTSGEVSLDVEVEGLPQGIEAVRFEPSRVSASFRAPTGDEFARAQAARFRAVVDYADIARDTTSGSVVVGVRVPDGVDARGVRAMPGRVNYFLVRRAAPEEEEPGR